MSASLGAKRTKDADNLNRFCKNRILLGGLFLLLQRQVKREYAGAGDEEREGRAEREEVEEWFGNGGVWECAPEYKHFYGEQSCNERGDLRRDAKDEHTADEYFNDTEIPRGEERKMRPVRAEADLQRFLFFPEVPCAEVEKRAAETEAQERVREE